MFDKFKTMGALAGLMQNREALREAGERIREALSATVVTGESGGGAVRVEMACDMRVRRVELPAGGMADEGSRGMLESLVAEAMNDAIRRAREAMERVIAEEANGLGLPPELGGQLSELIR